MVHVNDMASLGKGRYKIIFDNGIEAILYRGEASRFQISSDCDIEDQTFEELMTQVVGKRAKKRAMYLLEQMDRTESQLRDKLKDYPSSCIDDAIDYLKSFHYLDDERYARHFVEISQNSKSRQQIRLKLLQKGLSRDIIDQALEECYENDELAQIGQLLRKKGYDRESCDQKEFARIYNFLLRRGFKSNDILKAMKAQDIVEY